MRKRGLLVLLCVFLMVGMLSGCGGKGGNTDSSVRTDGQEITLKWMLAGGAYSPSDEAEVRALYNEKLAEALPGVQIDFEVVPFGDYAQRLQLALTAREELDLIWSGYVISYVNEAANGSFMAMDDLLKEYGKDMLEEIPDWAWEQQRVNGKIYSVPNMQEVTNEGKALFFQTEQGAKYMDREKLTKILNSSPTVTQEGWDAIGEYLEVLKQNGELKKGVSTASVPSFLSNTNTEAIVDNFVIVRGADEIKVEHLFERPEKQLSFDVMADWYKKGYIVEDIASMESASQYEFKEDGNVLWAHNYFKDIEIGQRNNGRPFVDVIPIKGLPPYISMGNAATSTSIAAYSTNAIPAMEVLDLMNTKKGTDLFNLLVYGVEGKHYEMKNNKVSYIRDAQQKPLYKLERWVVGNTFNGHMLESDPDGWFEYLLNDVQGPTAETSPLLGFKPDVSKLSTELTHIRAVEGEFSRSLNDGALPDHRATYEEMMGKLKTAGLEKVKAELQSQIDAFLAAKK
ncbi:MAG: extracellular solute-binding protein [Clostridia bacterium]|nr:extracellular solute-binding protein [Clostridia bacterium]